MIKAVIIEDEPLLRETNYLLLEENFPDISVVGMTGKVEEAVKIIDECNPQLVLMDIKLEDGNSFQIFKKCKSLNFKPIFITAFNEYAIKAIKFSAIDYILKPVNEYEFCYAVEQAIKKIEKDEIKLQTDIFNEHYATGILSKKLVLRTSDALHLVNVEDILYCKSDNSYTTFFMKDGQEIIVSKSIKEYSGLLTEYHFLRPHQSFLVNLNGIKKIDKSDGGFIIMQNGKEIPISYRRKQMIMDELDKL